MARPLRKTPSKTHAGERRPICIFAWKDYLHESELKQALDEQGFECAFLRGPADLIRYIQDEACFVLFINPRECPDVYNLLLRLPPQARRIRWVVVSRRLGHADTARYWTQGASDILVTPVHPITLKGRAWIQFNRHLEQEQVPEDLLLPAGLQRRARTDGGTQASIELDAIAVEKAIKAFAPSERNFGTVDQPDLRQQLFRYSVAVAAEARLWTPGRQERLEAVVVAFDESHKKLRLRLLKGPVDKRRFAQIRLQCEGKGILCNLRLGAGNLFLREEFSIEDEVLELDLGNALYEMQRRRALRIFWSGSDAPSFQALVNGKQLRGIVRDASSTGFGLELSTVFSAGYQTGDLCEIEFRLGTAWHKCRTIIHWRSPPNAEKGDVLRMGLRTIQMSDELRAIIDKKALDQLAKVSKTAFR
jgi:hypothetical protein